MFGTSLGLLAMYSVHYLTGDTHVRQALLYLVQSYNLLILLLLPIHYSSTILLMEQIIVFFFRRKKQRLVI